MSQAPLMKIMLNLARTKAFPEGSSRHGIEFIAPVDSNGHIDHDSWKAKRNACTVLRFWGDEPARRGMLVHRAGGDKGATWGFDYDQTTHADDESGFKFADHVMKVDEYVSIRDADGELETFRIVAVRSA